MNTSRSRPSLILLLCVLVALAQVTGAQTTNDLPGRTVVKLLPDYLRPRVYALNSGASSGGTGSLVALNASNGVFLAEVTLGTTPTDMDIDPSGQFLYVIHFGNNTISQINLDSFTVAQTRSFPPPGSGAGNHYNLKCGRNNRLYWLDAMWAPALHIMDFSTGTQVGAYDSGEGFGDLVLSPDKKDVFVWRQYGWSAGSANSWIWRLSLSSDVVNIQDTSTAGFGRDPLDSPILISGSGDRVFRNQYVLYTTNLPSVALMFPDSDVVYAITYFGDVAFSSTRAYNARNGAILYNLPISTTVLAVSGDQQRLLLANSSAQQIVTLPMSAIAPVPSAGITPSPADGATVSLPLDQLAWTWPPGALSFRVYFGTNQAAVAAAGTNSPLYQGNALTFSLGLTNALAAGATYYWRVDPLGLTTIIAGPVWSFQTAPIIASPLSVEVTTITTFNASQTLSITSGGLPQSWSLSESVPWLSASATNGVTPSAVTLNFQSAGLAPGTYTASIQLISGASVLSVPVKLEVVPLDLVKMVTDYQRPYIYALQRSPAPGKPASVLFINTVTEQIEKVLPILTDPRDLCVHPRENRLYIVDWLTGYLRVVDLNTQTPLPSLAVHLGLDRVNAARAGRVIMEDWNQWIGVFAIDTTVTTNGILPQIGYLREGDGETSPDGRYYYHCDNNISSASASKFDMVSDGFGQVGGSSTSHPYGSRQLYLSPDGSRLFWQGYMYDTTLSGPGANVMQELAGFGQQIWASTSNAWFAIGDSSVFDTRSAAAIHNLGINTGVKALSRDDSKLFQFDPTMKQLVVVSMSTVLRPKITANPAPQSVAAGTTVNFSGSSQGASPLTFQWLFNGAVLDGATNLNLTLLNVQSVQSGDYVLRVSNPYGAATSAVATLVVLLPPVITQFPSNLTVRAGSNALFSAAATGSAPLRFQWQFEGVNLVGATNTTLLLSNAQDNLAGAYRVVVVNAVGSATSASGILRVLPGPPQFVQQPADTTTDAGATARLAPVVIGSEPMSFQWFFANTPQPGANAATLILPNAQAPLAGQYFCVASNGYGSATSTVARLTIISRAPVIVAQPLDRVVIAGSNASFTVGVQGTEPLGFQWRQNGSALSGATNASFLLSNVQPVHAGDYSVVAFNPLGSTSSLVAKLTVNVPARITTAPANRLAMLGESVTFSVGIDGTMPLLVQWQFNGTNIMGATNLSLVLSNLTFAQAGSYRVIGTNFFGNAAATAMLSVLPRAGMVVAWGDNSLGQSTAPMFPDVVRVAGGNFHSLALRTNGTIVGWGDNFFGQSTPLPGLSNVTAIAAGDGFSLVLRANGSVTAWGDNSSAQTNLPPTATNIIAISAGQAHGLALRASGSMIAWGNNAYGQAQAPPNTDLVAISAGEIHSLALRRNGIVLGWGNNEYGQSTPPLALSDVIAISAGYLHSLALRADGSVVAWGDNTFGQTNVPVGLSNVTAIAAGELHSSALRADGAIVAWGNDSYGQLDTPVSIMNVLSLSSGYYHQLAILPLPALRFSPIPAGMVLWWDGLNMLQRAPFSTGPFTDLTSSTPWTNSWQNGSNSFYRLKSIR